MKKVIIIFPLLLSVNLLLGQLELGYVFGLDFYQRYENPSDQIAYEGAGNVLLSPFIGPKLWLGGEAFSLSLEGQVNLGLTTLAIRDYKGLGSVSFPFIAKLNFSGLSGMDKEFKWGFYLGAGMQWTKTELFYLGGDFKNLGVERELFPLYVVELGLGRGGFGVDGGLYARYGFHPDLGGSSFHIGLIFNFLKSFERLPVQSKDKSR
jgi:hypothetical protein